VVRSGGTITAGRLLGYKREEAAEYAFLLAVPAVFASGFYKLADIGGSGLAPWARRSRRPSWRSWSATW